MPISVPQSVFDKYFDVIDSTFDIFGVICQLVSIELIEEIIYPDNNLPVINSINNTIIEGDYNIGTKTIREVETLTDIKLKVYWDAKEWIGVGDNNLNIPNGSIQTIGFMSDLQAVLSAKQLIVHKGIKDIKEMRFTRFGEHIPMGLKQERYFACFWERTS
jgi:hypothetical protein